MAEGRSVTFIQAAGLQQITVTPTGTLISAGGSSCQLTLTVTLRVGASLWPADKTYQFFVSYQSANGRWMPSRGINILTNQSSANNFSMVSGTDCSDIPNVCLDTSRLPTPPSGYEWLAQNVCTSLNMLSEDEEE